MGWRKVEVFAVLFTRLIHNGAYDQFEHLKVVIAYH